MKEVKQNIYEVDIEDLVSADWNYKKDGTDDQYEKLIESIKQDQSLGVMAVRELPDGKFEVVDGNHRLEAAKRMGLEKVFVENFGDISLAKAITIARRRNHNWFEDDKYQLIKIMNEHVFPEYEMEDLTKYMPESLEELLQYKEIANLEWSAANEKDQTGDSPTHDFDKKVTFYLTEEAFNVWDKLKKTLMKEYDLETDTQVFEFIVLEAEREK